jgi:hypothetical protein
LHQKIAILPNSGFNPDGTGVVLVFIRIIRDLKNYMGSDDATLPGRYAFSGLLLNLVLQCIVLFPALFRPDCRFVQHPSGYRVSRGVPR